jgi:hypothetical protein
VIKDQCLISVINKNSLGLEMNQSGYDGYGIEAVRQGSHIPSLKLFGR